MSTLEWNVSTLETYVGGLSKPSKMPGLSYSIPAEECNVGAKLRAVVGSVCSFCYAMKGAYPWPSTQTAMYRRFNTLNAPLWVEAMSALLNRKKRHGKLLDFMRWHDAGDLQSLQHLRNIVEVARLTPGVKHWIPTREYRIVTDFVAKGGVIPDNLNIRLSAHMIGGFVPSFPRLVGVKGITISTVGLDDDANAWQCPARLQDNYCGSCRACWDTEVPHTNYPKH